MRLTQINGVMLELLDKGWGEPVVFVHGSMGDECAAVLTEPILANHYRLIHYHRRGFGRSECPTMPVTFAQQVADLKAVMHHRGVTRAHLVGESCGAAILLQFALDEPELVHSLALLEPAGIAKYLQPGETTQEKSTVQILYESGDKAGAINAFAQGVAGVDYRTDFDKTLPPGWFERYAAEADTVFLSDIPSLRAWYFNPVDAARIRRPVLNMVGARTTPTFRKVHEAIQLWLPHAESFVLPDASHTMLVTNPKGAAERLASFFSSHPIRNGI
jgi:pimeloyl-ACP methyl ester carboxylesterase